jgi:hypothetical protein
MCPGKHSLFKNLPKKKKKKKKKKKLILILTLKNQIFYLFIKKD